MSIGLRYVPTQKDSAASLQGITVKQILRCISIKCSNTIKPTASGRVVCVRTSEYHNYLPMITFFSLEWIPWTKVMLCGIPHWWCACCMNSWIVVLAEALLIRKGSLQPEYIPYRVTLPFSERKRFNVTSLPACGLLISSWNGTAWKVQS